MALHITDRHQRLGGVAILVLIGFLLLVVQIHNIWDDVTNHGESVYTAFLEFAFPGALTILLMLGAWWLWNSRVEGRHVLRIGQWSGGAILGALFLLAWTLGIQLFVSNGTEIYVLVANSVLIAAVGGAGVGIYSVQQSEQKAKLEESEERYRSLTEDVLDSSDVGLFILDNDHQVVWLNDASERYFDIDRKNVVGTDMGEFAADTLQHRFEDPSRFNEFVHAAYRENTNDRFECHVLPDGDRQERWLEHRSQPIESGLYEGGRIEHYTDTTEQVRTTRALERRETVLRRLHDVFLDSSRSFDDEVAELLEMGRDAIGVEHAFLSTFSETTYEIQATARSDETFIGKTFDPDETYCQFVEMTESTCVFEHVSEDRPELTNRAWYTDLGIEYYIGIPVFVQGTLYGTLCFLDTDGRTGDDWEVTLCRIMANWVGYELEQERRDRERSRLEFINRLIRHNLLNNLNVVTARTDLVDGAVEGEAAEHMDTIQGRITEMTDLIETMRTFMRVIVDHEDHEHEPIQLDSALRNEVLKAETDYEHATIELTDVPNVKVVADQLLPELFVNLLANAIEHNDRAEPHVDVSVETTETTVVVEIADNGPGVPQEVKERVFEKGEKGNDSAGTGLGLYLVKELVDAYNGHIEVTDNDPTGAVFTLTLPRHTTAPAKFSDVDSMVNPRP